MKLSICIPIYNFDVNNLVFDIWDQINRDKISAEIILIDDASNKEFIAKNKNLKDKISQFIFLEKNIGRSRIRNLFLKYAQSDYLLFLDCDGKIINPDFLKIYSDYIDNHYPDIIYGGRKVENIKPDNRFALRWKFAVERENLSVEKRIKKPYFGFQTNNFVVKKEILAKNPFDEEITQYGYEDLAFAIDLYQHKIKINHIENPVLNGDVESNEIFLSKADQSAKSLAQLLKRSKSKDQIVQIKLAKIYFIIKKTHSATIFRFFYHIFKSWIERKLLEGNSSLRFLDLYKLGQLLDYMHFSK